MNRYAIIAIAMVAGAVLVAGTAVSSTMAASEGKMTSNTKMGYKDGVFVVKAGSGGPVAPLTKFSPKIAEIKAGESVTWYNLTRVGEPHTVTFVMDEDQWADFVAPFTISNSTSVVPLQPGANAEALTFPGPAGTAMLGLNARSLNPAIVAADGAASYMPPNANYTLTGTEKYVNSGWIWPAGQTPQGLQEISTFSVKFEEVGTYDYICVVHPWMTGQVVVK